METKSFTITESQKDWLESHIASGNYENESELIRELIRERQRQEEISENEVLNQFIDIFKEKTYCGE